MIDENQMNLLQNLAQKLDLLEYSGNEYMEEIVVDDRELVKKLIKVSKHNLNTDNIVFMILGFGSLDNQAPIKILKRHIYVLNDIIEISEELHLYYDIYQDTINYEYQFKQLVEPCNDDFHLSYFLVFLQS